MKKLNITTTLLLCALWISQNVKAQENLVSVGPIFSLPIGNFDDFANFGLGGFARFEFGFTKNMAAGFKVELNYFKATGAESLSKTYNEKFYLFVPVMGFFKYYFIEQSIGPYVALNTGLCPMIMYGTDDVFNAIDPGFDVRVVFGPEIGANVIENVGVALTCDMLFYGLFNSTQNFYGRLTYINLRSFVSF